MKILVIEDNPTVAASLGMMLRAEEYEVETTDSGEDGVEIAKLWEYDIVILDLMLPDIDGFEVLRRLRGARVRTPVLVLSGASDISFKLKALNLGADDFLLKPFDRRELIARVQAIVRRCKGHADAVIRTGKLLVDLDRRVAEVDGKRLPVTMREYGILELLSRRKGAVVAKQAFLTHLYDGNDPPSAKIIDVFVCKLRKKISKATNGDDYIETARGRGYALRAPEHAPA